MLLPNSAEVSRVRSARVSRKNTMGRLKSESSNDYKKDPSSNLEDFLQKRREVAAGIHSHEIEMDADSLSKKRTQVVSALTQAKERISQLGLNNREKKHEKHLFWTNLQNRICGTDNKIGLRHTCQFSDSLKAIEGKFGSSMMLTFAFFRWVLFLNTLLSCLWIGAVVIPFLYDPPDSYSWSCFKQFFQVNGLDKTWVYYGGYLYKPGEQKGWYKTDFIYPCTIIAMFLLSLATLLTKIARRIMGSGDTSIVYASVVYPYATLVFASWDFRITSVDAAAKLRRGIRMQLREMLADSKSKEEKLSSSKNRLMIYKKYGLLLIVWPLLMSGSAAAVVFLVSRANEMLALNAESQYAQSALLSLLNMSGPPIIRLLVVAEGWKPAYTERVNLIKMFMFRALNLGTLLYRWYVMLTSGYKSVHLKVFVPCGENFSCTSEGFQCCRYANYGPWNTCPEEFVGSCEPSCMENEVGKQILRLIATSTAIGVVVELAFGFGYVIFLHEKKQFLIEDSVIEIVYIQALVWVGSHFSPMSPILGMISNFINFYCMKLSLIKTCTPMLKLYSASRTSNITYGLLLATLIFYMVPASILMTDSSSGICGPLKSNMSMYQTLSQYVQDFNSSLWLLFEWLGSPSVLAGAIFLLIFIVILLRAKLVQAYKQIDMRNRELDRQRRESKEKYSLIKSQLNPTSV